VIGTLVQDADSATATLTAPTNDPGSGEYIVVHLGTLGGATSDALGINDRGQAVGWSRDAMNRPQAFLWQNGSMSGLGFLPGWESSVAQAINNHGEITGYARVSASSYHTFIYTNNSMVDIGPGTGLNSMGRAINDRQDVCGSVQTPNLANNQSFLMRNAQYLLLEPYTLQESCDAHGINQEGRICGVTHVFSTSGHYWGYVHFDNNGNMATAPGPEKEDEMKLLGTLGTTNTIGEMSGATDINDLGQVVGWTGITNDVFPRHAFLVTPSNGIWKLPHYGANQNVDPVNTLMQDLGALESPANSSYANALNNSAWIVGYSTTASGTNQAFLWRGGVMTNLNDLIPPNSGWVLTNATGINEHNEIVGSGLYQGQSRAYMLRQGGRISKVVPIIQTNLWVFTNEFDEVVTQEFPHVEAQVIEWAGIWSTNVDIPVNFTVEYCNHLQTHEWAPVAPTSQWPILVNFWTNTDFNSIRMRHFRIRAQEY
jgi:probable HAF family extracellular repeat protein